MTYVLLSQLHPLWRRMARWAASVGILSVLAAACGDADSARPTDPQRIPVASVRIEPFDATLLVGAVHPLQARALSATGTVLDDRAVLWESDNLAVASVSTSGVVAAHAAGTAGIRASSEGKSSRIEVRIVSPNPIPVLASLEPAVIAAGSTGPMVVDVSGTGFTDATRLKLDGVEQATRRVDATTLRLELSTAAMATVTTYAVTAETPAPGGGVSDALTLTIANVPAPSITSLDPSQITAGWGAAFTVTITGTGFTPRSTVSWDGVQRATRYVSPTSLQITIDPVDVRVARTVPVVVETPAPGGGQASSTFAVNAVPVARVTVDSPWGFAWTWTNHRLPLTAVAEDHLGREITDRRAMWNIADPQVASLVPLGDREVAVYGAVAGETEVEATVDGVHARRTVRVHDVPNFELVYEAGDGDDRHLMLWDLTTASAPRRLATPMAAFSPAPSPDGREIAFAGVDKGSGPSGNVDLVIAARDGSTRRVVPTPAFEADPSWSPDGRKLAFTSNRASGLLDVFTVDLASGAVTRLTNADLAGSDAGSGTGARAPAWSPDGNDIAYTVQTATGSQLWLMAADGSRKRQLTNSPDANDLEPSWSPDGSMIVFAREYRQPQGAVVMSVNRDGTNLMNYGGRVVSVSATPALSPDGRWLTTSQSRGSGAGAIYAASVRIGAGPRIILPEALGGGRHARWVKRP